MTPNTLTRSREVPQTEVRVRLLRTIREMAGADCERPVPGTEAGERIGLSRERTYQLVEALSREGMLQYLGAGPRVCITRRGLELLDRLEAE